MNIADNKSPTSTEGSKFVHTRSGIEIAIQHNKGDRDKVVVVAPGFFQSKEAQVFREIKNDLFKHFDVISMDFRGHGKSKGLYTFSSNETEDLAAVLNYARQFYKRIGVIGFSYAGAIAMLGASQDRNMDSLVCVSAPMASERIEFEWWKWASFKLAFKGLRPGAGIRPGNPFMKKIRPIDIVDTISPTPILFVHGAEDPTVNLRHSVLLHQKAREPKSLRVIDKASHAEDMYRTHQDEFMKTVVDWFKRTLAE